VAIGVASFSPRPSAEAAAATAIFVALAESGARQYRRRIRLVAWLSAYGCGEGSASYAARNGALLHIAVIVRGAP